MSADFVKVYSGFFEGSLRDQPPYARLLFLAMLSQADPDGVALGAVSFWAAYVGITKEQVQEALIILSSPDPDSTTPDLEGRRIEPWGEGANRWRIVNYRQYYEKSRNEDRAEYKRQWDREHAEKRHKSGSKRENPTKPDKPDPERKGKERKENTYANSEFDAFWRAYPRRGGSNPKHSARVSFDKALAGGADPAEIVEGAKAYARFLGDEAGTKYVAQAVTWLNQKRWGDDYGTPEEIPWVGGIEEQRRRAERWLEKNGGPNATA